MPSPTFLVFEFTVYVLALLCLRHALYRGRYRALEFVVGIVYGLLLEAATIWQLQGYHYGRFLVMFGEVPLCVGVGWGVIIYSAMETSDRWGLAPWARPLADALQAWNIDLSMDAIAIRLGFWTWAVPGEWFGVPYGNFFAWFVVTASFSGFIRLLRGWRERGMLGYLYPWLATLFSLVTLLWLDQAYVDFVFPHRLQLTVLSALLMLGVSTLWFTRRIMYPPQSVDWPVALVPLVFHVYYTAALFLRGYYRQAPPLAVVSIAMLLLGFAVHLLLPWLIRRYPSATDGDYREL